MIRLTLLTSTASKANGSLSMLILGISMLLTIVYFSFIQHKYQQVNARYTLNERNVLPYLVKPVLVRSKQEHKVKLVDLDRLMEARPLGMQFDQIHMAKNVPLQIEGTTLKNTDVSNLVSSAKSRGLILQIQQVQREENLEHQQGIKFELKQAIP